MTLRVQSVHGANISFTAILRDNSRVDICLH